VRQSGGVSRDLPYNIATPVLSNLLASAYTPHTMVATIQLELAQRIVAEPWSKDYSALSAWMQCQADVEIVREMAPTVFWPEPKVQSAIVRITIDPGGACRARFAVLPVHEGVFCIAGNSCGPTWWRHEDRLTSPTSTRSGEMALAPDARTEQLDVPTLLWLAELVRRQAPWAMSREMGRPV
jgi:16S rRNA (adenine1518-N6/adenine1519-N6)-dimethyltransferase